MSLINKVLPGLYNGVSQQSPALRLDTQCEDQINCLVDIARGLRKRPPTRYVATLSSQANASSFTHIINRDSTERYTAIFTGDAEEPLEVFTQDGVKCSVRYGQLTETLQFTEDLTVRGYIQDNDPLRAFKATTVADHTIVVNRNKECKMSGELSAIPPPTAIVFVKRGVADTDYNVFLNGEKAATFTTGSTAAPTTWKTTNIANQLYTQLVSGLENALIITCKMGTRRTPEVTITIAGITKTVAAPFTIISKAIRVDLVQFATNIYTAFHGSLAPADWDVIRIGASVYVVHKDGTPFSYTVETDDRLSVTPPDPLSTPWLVHYESDSNVISIKRADGGDFSFEVTDSWANQALVGAKSKVQSFTDLPPLAPEGMVLGTANKGDQVVVDASTHGYYFKYKQFESGSTRGVWEECVKDGLDNTFDATTMPHRLVRSGVNEFTLCPCLWISRSVGDDTTAPIPSFINNKINNVVFYRNRLGFLSGENVILSKAGEFFDFWPTTALDILDDDPIDIAVSTNEVAVLYHAVPFASDLMVFSDQQQFKLSSGQSVFTTKTVAADQATHFNTDRHCSPIPCGPNVYFVSPTAGATSIKEYFVQADTIINDAADITAHVPTYLPLNITKLAAHSGLDILFAFSPTTPNSIYTYQYYWQGEEKVQSAWGVWEFDSQILSIGILDSDLILVTKRNADIFLERVELSPTENPWYLDRQVPVVGIYNSEAGTTTWTLPYTEAEGSNLTVVDAVGNDVVGTATSGSHVSVIGDYSTGTYTIGKAFTKKYTFSRWYIKGQGSNAAILEGRLQIRNLLLHFTNTGYFRVEVENIGRDKTVNEFTGATIGYSELGPPPLVEGKLKTVVFGNNENVTITIVNDSHLPSQIVSGSWDGFYTVKSRTI